MTFTYEIAIKLVNHYQFLIGKGFDKRPSSSKVNYIIIAPYYTDGFNKFWEYFQDEQNFELALAKSGYNKEMVLVFAIDYDGFSNVLFYAEIDSYLKQMNIPKCYDENGSFIAI